MDGIDGIAGTEAVSVALCAGVLLFWSGSAGIGWLCIILTLAVSGWSGTGLRPKFSWVM